MYEMYKWRTREEREAPKTSLALCVQVLIKRTLISRFRRNETLLAVQKTIWNSPVRTANMNDSRRK